MMNAIMAQLENDKSRKLIDSLRCVVGDSVALPQIAVVGDTSAGKSSVLSALSGFDFPASDQLCTRCPIQLRLSRRDCDFTCTIGLRHPPEQAFQGASEYAPQTVDSMEGAAAAITEWMERAAGSGSTFSSTAVSISAEGRHLPSLTLIDLPGIVRTSKDRDIEAELIAQVKSMLLHFVRQPRTVILAVLAANVAVQNQEVLKMAKDADPQGRRTLAVLTKPDMIERGSEATVHDLMANIAFPITLGWASVKCRDRKDREAGMTIPEGIIHEASFFRSNKPWSDLNPSDLGCASLQARLSSLLHQRIADELPSVCAEAEGRLAEAQKELAAMGPVLESPEARRQAFDEHVRTAISLVEKSTQQYGPEEFFSRADTADPEANNCFMATVVKRLGKLRDAIYAASSLEREVDQTKLKAGDVVAKNYAPYKWTAKDVEATAQGTKQPHTGISGRFVADVYGSLQERRGYELPGFLSFSVFTQLFQRHVLSKWQAPTAQCSEDVAEAGRAVAKRASKESLRSSTRLPRLLGFLEQHVDEAVQHLKQHTDQQLEGLLVGEARPSTQNHYYYETVQQLRAEDVKRKVVNMRSLEGQPDKAIKAALTSLLEGHSNQSNEVHATNEMSIMLMAYSKVAMKRYVDNVEQKVRAGFVLALSEELQRRMKATDAMLEGLLGESAFDSRRRSDLVLKVKNLRHAVDLITEYRKGC